jgi:hypothetical protein
MLLGRARRSLEHWGLPFAVAEGAAVKKTFYAISLVLLLGALIVQSVWGANLP